MAQSLYLVAGSPAASVFSHQFVKEIASIFLLNTSTSQNHRMVGVGRDLCGSSRPTPLPKQGHLQQAAQDLVQAGLEYLQRRRQDHLEVLSILFMYCQQNKLCICIPCGLATLDLQRIYACPAVGFSVTRGS